MCILGIALILIGVYVVMPKAIMITLICFGAWSILVGLFKTFYTGVK